MRAASWNSKLRRLAYLFRHGVVILYDAAAPVIWGSTPCNGIRVVDPEGRNSLEVLATLEAAIAVLKEVDAKRWRIVKRYISTIVNMPMWESLAMYSPIGQVCTMDFSRLPRSSDGKVDTHFLAGILIHEATHGRIYSLGIWPTKQQMPRVEALCTQEMIRFGKRLGLCWSFLPDGQAPSYLKRCKETYSLIRASKTGTTRDESPP